MPFTDNRNHDKPETNDQLDRRNTQSDSPENTRALLQQSVIDLGWNSAPKTRPESSIPGLPEFELTDDPRLHPVSINLQPETKKQQDRPNTDSAAHAPCKADCMKQTRITCPVRGTSTRLMILAFMLSMVQYLASLQYGTDSNHRVYNISFVAQFSTKPLHRTPQRVYCSLGV